MLPTLLRSFLFFSGAFCYSEDLVNDLPGFPFKPTFDIYAGYLQADNNATTMLHYTFIESRNNVSTDPLIIWFNGGPLASAYFGLYSEIGPFYPTRDGSALTENVFAWNANANLLFIESPASVGFSYDNRRLNPNDTSSLFTLTVDEVLAAINGTMELPPNVAEFLANRTYATSDDSIARGNYRAINEFFRKFPQFVNSSLFIMGESYGGIYVPTLARIIIRGINSEDFPNKNLEGIAIGNGIVDMFYNDIAMLIWSHNNGRISTSWNALNIACNGRFNDPIRHLYRRQVMGSRDYLIFATMQGLWKKDKGEGFTATYNSIGENLYDFYLDCYGHVENETRAEELESAVFHDDDDDYECIADMAMKTYLSRADVQRALHVSPKWMEMNKEWSFIATEADRMKHLTHYFHTKNVFNDIFDEYKKPLKVLIYAGDTDSVVPHLGSRWFVHDFAEDHGFETQVSHSHWSYRGRAAGFLQSYTRNRDNKTMTTLSVKGAGHKVPSSRPGAALQMITNFIRAKGRNVDYSKPIKHPRKASSAATNNSL